MAEFDPFEREFRRQATNLRRTPSGRSWNRIERRLDRRNRSGSILGIRPWMIAALLLLVAGVFTITGTADRQIDVLAQRSEAIQELHTPYVPAERFEPKEYRGEAIESISQPASFRDVTVAAKHRVHG